MPRSGREGWIDWTNSAAREILMEDLERSGWLYKNKESLTAKEVFDVYKKEQVEFENVLFSQFQDRYIDATTNAVERRKRSTIEQKWFEDYRKKHPLPTQDKDGKPIFSAHSAQELLNEDVKNGLDLKFKSVRLWASRKEYSIFDFSVFNRRVIQARRRVKLCNYMNFKRQEKRRAYKEAREKLLQKKNAAAKKAERERKEKAEKVRRKMAMEAKKQAIKEEKTRKRLERETTQAEKRRILEEKRKERERKKIEREQKKKQKIADQRAKQIERASKKRRRTLPSATSHKRRRVG